MANSWTRKEVTYCSCTALSYTHAHCPCLICNGKAVSRSTEYRHWLEANVKRALSETDMAYRQAVNVDGGLSHSMPNSGEDAGDELQQEDAAGSMDTSTEGDTVEIMDTNCPNLAENVSRLQANQSATSK